MSEALTAAEGPKSICLAIEVSGCACTCNHCGNEGHPYPSMELGVIEQILAQGAQFCSDQGLKFSSYPMHDFMMHKHAPEIVRLFDSYGYPIWYPVATTPGPVLAQRTDHAELLCLLKERGATMVWFAFHGLDDVHDRAVARKGAFAKCLIALERVRSAGLRCGAAIYITTDNLHQIPEMVDLFGSTLLDCRDYFVATFSPHPRGRAYEAKRPALEQLAPYEKALQVGDERDFWGNLEKYTEADYVNRALTEPELDEAAWAYNKWFNRSTIDAVCLSNLDVRVGQAGLYGRFLGNVEKDGVQPILKESLNAGFACSENLYFPDLRQEDIPTVAELARGWGNPQNRKVYRYNSEMRVRWLDLWLGAR